MSVAPFRIIASVVLLLIAGCGDVPSADQRPSADPRLTGVGDTSAPGVSLRASEAETSTTAEGAESAAAGRPPNAQDLTADASSMPALVPQPEEPPPGPPPLPNDTALAAAGLRVQRLSDVRLITDLPPAATEPLAPFAEAMMVALPEAFGDVPPGSDSPTRPRLTALVVGAEERFLTAGLLRQSLPEGIHGRSDGWRFRMRWPSSKDYQRHLFAHEAAHCWTMAAGGHAPVAVLEGLAEWFATHRVVEGRVLFGAVPHSPHEVRGWGRIGTLKELLADDASRRLSATQVVHLRSEEFQGRPTAYAWAWAWAVLLDRSPQTHRRFRQLAAATTAGEDVTGRAVLLSQELDRSGRWNWWLDVLGYGVDPRLAAPAEAAEHGELWIVPAAAGWVETSVTLPPGASARATAEGRVTLGTGGRPWESGPDGIRLDYASGRPIGRLMVCFRSGSEWSEVNDVGGSGVVTNPLPTPAVLCLRVNDDWSELADNGGEFRVAIDHE